MTQGSHSPPGEVELSLRSAEVAALLLQVTSELSQVLDVDWALSVILRKGRALLGSYASVVMVFDPSGRPIHRQASHASPVEADALTDAFERLWAARRLDLSASPILVPDLASCSPALPELQQTGAQACLILILALRGGALGAIAFLFDSPRVLGAESVMWARVFAGHAAFALENSHLFETTLRQSAELGAFYETAAAMADQPDLSLLLNLVIGQAARLLDCQQGQIYLADEEARQLSVVARFGPANLEGSTVVPFGQGIPGHVAETRQALRHSPGTGAPTEGSPARLGEEAVPGTQTLAVPMLWRQQLLGVMVLEASGRRPFSDTDLGLAKLVAYQGANALGIAKLVEAERRQRRMAEALESASLGISRATELDEVLERILEQVMYAFPCDASNLETYDGGNIRVLRSRGYGRFGLTPEDMQGMSLLANEHPSTKRMMVGEAVVIPDTAQERTWVARPGLEWIRSWAGVPIRYGEEVLGFINLDSAQPNAFDDTTPQRLLAFAAHAAAAMHHARLFQRLIEEHQRLKQVYETGHSLSGTLDPNEILDHLLRGVLRAVGGHRGAVYVPLAGPPAGMALRRMMVTQGVPPEPPTSATAEAVAYRTFREGKPQLAADTSPEGRCWVVSFPLHAGDRRFGIGLVWVPSTVPDRSEWLDMLGAIGQEAGLALANAEQHAQVQRRLAEMTLLQRVVGDIARRLDVDAVLEAIAQLLHSNLGFPSVEVFRREGQELVLNKVAGPRPMLERVPLDRGIIGRVARTGLPARVEDVRLDPDYLPNLVGTRAELAVPVRHGSDIIGVINIETSDPSQVDQAAFELLALLADQVSIALQNASLYEQVARNVETLEGRVRERTAQLELAVQQAHAAERAKTQFVADVSHELRTPLTNIGLYLDLLEIGGRERWDDYMTTLRHETGRLAGLIEQLLTISQLDSGQVQVKLEVTDVNSLMQVLVGDRERLIASKGLHLEVRQDPALPKALADPQQLMQVMTNLLTNATNYTPSGGRILLETRKREWRQQPWVTLAVTDSGPGIPPDERRKVFDRFFRGLAGRSSGIAGTGLGLAICKEIIDRHNGRIEFASRVGEGSSFTVWVPAAAPDQGPAD